MGQHTKRIVYFDALTIAAAFAVVALHCNGLVHTYSDTTAWKSALVVEVVFYWAVPVFFMLTGANNLTYRARHTTREFLVRRMKRLFIPYVAWSLIVYVLRFGIEPGTLGALSAGGFYTGFMTNTIEGVYWFFPVIIGLTLAMPALSLLVEHRRTMWYVVGAAFVLQFTVPPLAAMAHVPWNAAFSLPVASGYVAYALAGYLLATQEVPRRVRWAVYAAAVACLALRYGYTLVSSEAIGQVDRTLFDYNMFTAAFPAAAVFLLFKQLLGSRDFSPRVAGALKSLSGCAFGVYLVHKILLDDVVFRCLGVTPASLALRVVGPFVLFAVAAAIVFVMKKVPGLRVIVP